MFVASDFSEATIGKRQTRATSRLGLSKPVTSPFFGLDPLDPSALAARTLELVSAYPASASDLIEASLASWDALVDSTIGRATIGRDIFPAPQVIGGFLHELIPLEMHARHGADWRPDTHVSEKDLVYVPNDQFSAEIKTSSHQRQIFGNRSFGQQNPATAKKLKSGYYLAINFTGWARDEAATVVEPGINLIRFGWLDHVDWLSQAASTGQAASLPASIENAQLLTIYSKWE